MKFLTMIFISSIGWGQQLVFDDFESGKSWTEGSPDLSISTAPETEANIGVFLVTMKKKEEEPFAQRTFDKAWVENAHQVAKEFYSRASFGKMNVTSSYLGEFELEYDEPKCDASGWADAVINQAEERGIDISSYRYRNFYVNIGTEIKCQWSGIANRGCGTICNSWIVADHEDGKRHGILIHEIGHNLGFGHASTDLDDNGVADEVYGDQYDLMGNAWNPHRHFNAPHTRHLNWFEESNILATTTGTHSIAPLSESTADLKDLIVDGYEVSYRRRLDLDAQIPSPSKLGIWKNNDGGSFLIKFLSVGDTYKSITYLREEDGRAIVTLDPLPPEPEPINGLAVKAYEGTWDRLPDFSQLQPVEEGFTDKIDTWRYTGQDNYGLVFEGWAKFDHSDNYMFRLGSDDGSRFFMDDELLIDNDGLHGMIYKMQARDVSKGAHKIRIEYFERTGGDRLDLIFGNPVRGYKRFTKDNVTVRKPDIPEPPPENIPPQIEMIESATMKIGEVRYFSASWKDLDGVVVDARWSFISGPGVNQFSIWDTHLFRFAPTTTGEYIFRFTIRDNDGSEVSKDLKVIVDGG